MQERLSVQNIRNSVHKVLAYDAAVDVMIISKSPLQCIHERMVKILVASFSAAEPAIVCLEVVIFSYFGSVLHTKKACHSTPLYKCFTC